MQDLPSYHLMRRDLTGELPAPVWPEGAHLKPFAESDVPAAHTSFSCRAQRGLEMLCQRSRASARQVGALLTLAYANGGGSVPGFEEWWSALSTDSEYDPALCFPVCGNTGALNAFVLALLAEHSEA